MDSSIPIVLTKTRTDEITTSETDLYNLRGTTWKKESEPFEVYVVVHIGDFNYALVGVNTWNTLLGKTPTTAKELLEGMTPWRGTVVITPK